MWNATLDAYLYSIVNIGWQRFLHANSAWASRSSNLVDLFRPVHTTHGSQGHHAIVLPTKVRVEKVILVDIICEHLLFICAAKTTFHRGDSLGKREIASFQRLSLSFLVCLLHEEWIDIFNKIVRDDRRSSIYKKSIIS